MEKLKWKTEKRLIKDLMISEINPRKISKEKKEALSKSLQKFNLADIPVLNTDNTIISGNQRLQVLYELGQGNDEIDVRVPNRKLTEQELKEYMLIANTHAGVFDVELLEVNFKDVEIEFEIPKTIEKEQIKDNDSFGTTFTLSAGSKSPFQQITFTLSDDQHTEIKNAIYLIKEDVVFSEMQTFGNQNSNGNALSLIVTQWMELRKTNN